MNSATIRTQIRAVVYGIFGIISAIVLIRIILVIVGANPGAPFVSFWFDISGFFINIFRSTYPILEAELLKVRIELYSVFALLFYTTCAFLVQKSFTSFTREDPIEVVKAIIDSLFKFAEALLITRFLFKLTGASVVGIFVKFIYEVSAIVYEPFRGILPTIQIGDLGIIIESSTVIAIIVIVIFDAVTEGVIDSLTGHKKFSAAGDYYAPPAPVVHNQPAQQQPQQITINIPHSQQQPPQQIIDRRTVQVVTPTPPRPAYPYYGQNDLNQQRPPHQLGYKNQQPQGFNQPPRNPNAPGSRSEYSNPYQQ